MIIKVCGMRQAQNIGELECLCAPDMMGFIFYPGSSRYVAQKPAYLPMSCDRVGVFVNAAYDDIISKVGEYSLDYVQLHGDESADMCRQLREHTKVIKAIHIGDASDVDSVKAYDGACDMFVFETKCQGYGGSGRSFDWAILDDYRGRTPFLLTGGIGPEDAGRVNEYYHPMFAGVDLNSAFETSPGVKDIRLLTAFIEELR